MGNLPRSKSMIFRYTSIFAILIFAVCHSADVNETPNKKRLKKVASDSPSENDRQLILSTVSSEVQQSEERNSKDNLRSKVKSKKFQSDERNVRNSSSSSEIQSASSNSTGKQTTIAQNEENNERSDNNNDKKQLNSSEKIISALNNSKEKSTQVIALKTESSQRNAEAVEEETDENKQNPSTPTTNIEDVEEAETIKFHILTGIPPEEGELVTLKPHNINDSDSLTATTTRQPVVSGESSLTAKTMKSNPAVADRSASASPRSRQRESNEESSLTVGTRRSNPTVDDGSPTSSPRSKRPDIDEESSLTVDSTKTNPTAVDSAEDENPTVDVRRPSTDISQSTTSENNRSNVTSENRGPNPTEDQSPSVKITSPEETVLISTSRNPTAEDSIKTTKEDDDSDEESPPQTKATVTPVTVTSKKSPSSATAAFNQEKFQNLVHDKFVVLVCNMLAICIFNEADIKNQALLTNISNTFADFIEGDLSLKQQENTFPNTEIEQNIFLDEIIEKTTQHFKKSRHWTGDCKVSKKEISKIAGCEKVFSSTTEETSPSSEATSNGSSDADDETETEVNTVGLKVTTTSQVSKLPLPKLPVTVPVVVEKGGDSTSDESSLPATKLETDDQRHLMSFLQSFGFTTAFAATDEVKTHFITRQPITLPKKSFKQDSTDETDEASTASPTNTPENAATVKTSVNDSAESIVPFNRAANKFENLAPTTPSVSRRNESQEQFFSTMAHHTAVEEIATSTVIVNVAPQRNVVVGSINNQFANDFTTTKTTVGRGTFESEGDRVTVAQSSTPGEISQSGDLSPVESSQNPVSDESSKNPTSSESSQIGSQSPPHSPAAGESSRNPSSPTNNEMSTDTSTTTLQESTSVATMVENFSMEPESTSTETPQLTLPRITLTPVPEPKPATKGTESESTNMENTAVTVATNNEVKDLFWNLRLSSLMWSDEYADNTSVKFRELKNRLEPELNKIFEDLLRDKFIVLSIKRLSKGSVVVHGTVSVVDDTKSSRVTELEKEFENSIRRRSFKVSNYDIDPDTIQLRNEDSVQSGRDDFEKTNNLPKTDAASSQGGFPGYAIGIIIGLVLLIIIALAGVFYFKRMRHSGSEYIQNGSRQTTFPKPTQAYSGPSAYEMSGSAAAGAATPGNGAQVNAYLNHGYQRDRQNGQNRNSYNPASKV